MPTNGHRRPHRFRPPRRNVPRIKMSSPLRHVWKFIVHHLPRKPARLEDKQWGKLRERWSECLELSRCGTHDPEWLLARKTAVIDDVCHRLKTNNRYIAHTVIDDPWINLLRGGTFSPSFAEQDARHDFLVCVHGQNLRSERQIETFYDGSTVVNHLRGTADTKPEERKENKKPKSHTRKIAKTALLVMRLIREMVRLEMKLNSK